MLTCWEEMGGTEKLWEDRWSFVLVCMSTGWGTSGAVVWVHLGLETQVCGGLSLTSCVAFFSGAQQPGGEGQLSWRSVGVLSVDAVREGWSWECSTTNMTEKFLGYIGKSLMGKDVTDWGLREEFSPKG